MVILNLFNGSDGLKSCMLSCRGCYSFQVLLGIHFDICELLVNGKSNEKMRIMLCQVVYMLLQWKKYVKGSIMTNVIILYLNHMYHLSSIQRVITLKVVIIGYLTSLVNHSWKITGVYIVLSAHTFRLDLFHFFLVYSEEASMVDSLGLAWHVMRPLHLYLLPFSGHFCSWNKSTNVVVRRHIWVISCYLMMSKLVVISVATAALQDSTRVCKRYHKDTTTRCEERKIASYIPEELQ